MKFLNDHFKSNDIAISMNADKKQISQLSFQV